jgi:hypothetical protein
VVRNITLCCTDSAANKNSGLVATDPVVGTGGLGPLPGGLLGQRDWN